MLLSDWYAQWKENRIQAAVEEARAKAYEEGYAAGKSGKSDLTGTTVAQGQRPDVSSRKTKSHFVKNTEQEK